MISKECRLTVKTINPINTLKLVFFIAVLAALSPNFVLQAADFNVNQVAEATGFTLPTASAPLVNENVSETLHVNPSHPNASDSNPGTAERPLKTFKRGMALAGDRNNRKIGVRVLVYPGMYREEVAYYGYTDAPVIVEAKEPRKAIISGSDVWTGWSDQGNNTYTHGWPYNFGLSPIPGGWGDAPPIPDLVRRREMVFVKGKALRPVNSIGELSDNTFHINEANDTITIKLASKLGKKTVEVALRSRILVVGSVQNFVMRGLVFQHSASHFSASGIWLDNSKNVVLENNTFRWHSGGGLGMEHMTNVIMRRNRYMNNGTTGFGASRNLNMLVENEIANKNMWRGRITNWVDDWSIAGIKHLRGHNVTYRNVQTCNNYSHGFWLDSDHRNVLIDGFKTCNNASTGMFIEANWGPIGVRNSIIANNRDEGIRGANSKNVKLYRNILYGNGRSQIAFAGNSNGITVSDWRTGKKKVIPAALNWQIEGNIVIAKDPNSYLYQFFYSEDAFAQFQKSLRANQNVFYHRGGGKPFRLLWGNPFGLKAWQKKMKSDTASQWQDGCFRNPDKNDFTLTCQNAPFNALLQPEMPPDSAPVLDLPLPPADGDS